jgi:hypothetical protein
MILGTETALNTRKVMRGVQFFVVKANPFAQGHYVAIGQTREIQK